MVETGTALLEAGSHAGKQKRVGDIYYPDALFFPVRVICRLEVAMKLKFRRDKPPLQIMERGDVITVKEVKVKPWKLITILNAHVSLTLCPLCKKPMTKDNMHTVYLNQRTRRVHKTCPGILDG
jgi:hypothetical protein